MQMMEMIFKTVSNTTANKTNHIELVFVAFTKNSRERKLARPGCGFGRMVRISWYSAKQPGAQPSGTFSCQQAAN